MEQTLRNLPFVTEAILDEKDRDILHITTTQGETVPMLLHSMRGRMPDYDRDSVLKRVETKQKYFHDALENNSCYFLSSTRGSRTHLSANSVANKLPHMVEILRSGKSIEKKSQQIQELQINISNDEIINFSASPQLEARLNKLKTQNNSSVFAI